MYTTLIEPAALAARGAEPDWAVVDCRFDLARPAWGEQAFCAGHIPPALYAHLDRDLSGPVTPHSGRHPLPSVAALRTTFSGWGIDAQVQVIAYDQNNGMFAARLWWLLRWVGHVRVAVLNGGFAAWQQAGMPVSSQAAVRAARRFELGPPAAGIVSTRELAGWVRSGALTRREQILIDARAADRFAGENETLDPVAGHIPGARNHPFAGNLDSHGRFISAQRLREQWLARLEGAPARQSIAMCGSGVTACHNLLALELAGLPGGRLYDGSWSEWIRDRGRPVQTGEA